MNIATAIETMVQYGSPALPIILVGPPGVGKSDAIVQAAAAGGRACLIEHPVTADPVDYRGLPRVVDGHAEWLPIGNLRRITDPACPPTLVLCDDLGQASPAVQAAIMQMWLARRLGDHAIAATVSFAAATNRAADRSGARSLLAALTNRALVLSIATDPIEWAGWVLAQPRIDPLVAAYARFRGGDCFAAAVPIDGEPYCTPRSLAGAGELWALGARTIEILAGRIGQAAAADLVAYGRVWDRLPSIDEILTAPGAWAPPKDPGLMHAVTCLAARQAQRRPDEVLALADRIAGEWGTALASDAVRVWPELRDTAAFRRWAVAHQYLL